MTRRLKQLLTLAPGMFVAALCCAAASSSTAHGPGPCPAPPPCSPDGMCWPNYPTWGWYPTRWRSFPGDVVGPTPTEAEQRQQAATPEEELTGPQLPSATKESVSGPEKPECAARSPQALRPRAPPPRAASNRPAASSRPPRRQKAPRRPGRNKIRSAPCRRRRRGLSNKPPPPRPISSRPPTATRFRPSTSNQSPRRRIAPRRIRTLTTHPPRCQPACWKH